MTKIILNGKDSLTFNEFISDFDDTLYQLKQQLTGKQFEEITNKMIITIVESKED